LTDAATDRPEAADRRAPGSPARGQFEALLAEEQDFCADLGLPGDLVATLARSESDWAFILKIDALLEAAAREIIRRGLRRKVANGIAHGDSLWNDGVWDFLDRLPMRGPTSILTLLDAAQCPAEEHDLFDSIHKMKKAYADDIALTGASLAALIARRPDRAQLLRTFSAMEDYDEAALMKIFQDDGSFLRFCIVERTMRFLFFAYHVALKLGPAWPLARCG
jgi:hypothetical protein